MGRIICDLYGRVSTTEQAQSGYSIGEQEERLRKFAEAQGWVINNVCMDGGFSGASMCRPGLQTVIRDAEQGKIQKVVVYKLDRLSRSQKDTLFLIEDVFIKNGVSFVSMTESLDTATPFGMAMIGILSVFAQLERETIKERMTIGRDARVKSGKYRGSGHIPVGFNYDNGLLSENEYEAMIVRNLYEEYANGATANSLAVWMNNEVHFRQKSWSAEKVKRLLTQPLYIGRQRWKGEEFQVEGCPQIVPEELWLTVQKEIARRTARNVPQPQSPHKHTTLLGGLIWCGCCGQRYTAEGDTDAKGNRIHRYYCYGRVMKRHRISAAPCNNRSWNAKELNGIIVGEIRKLATDRSLLDNASSPSNLNDYLSKVRAINNRLGELETQMNRMIDLYSIGRIDVTAVADKADAIQKERESLTAQLESIKKPSGALVRTEAETALQTFADLVDSVDGNDMMLYTVVHQLVHSVTLKDDEVRIVWNFETETENL